MDPLRQNSSILLLTLGHVSDHINRFRRALEEDLKRDAVISSVSLCGMEQGLIRQETDHLLRCIRPVLLVVAFSESWSCKDASSFLSTIRDHTWNGRLLTVVTGVNGVYSDQLLASGAEEVVILPDEFSTLLLPRIARLFRTASPWTATEPQRPSPFADLVGRSVSFRAVLEKIPIVASSDSTVLITGETGTGKGMVARAIHALSKRAPKRFVSIQCGALPETLVENELFGHAPGAYTDGSAPQGGMVAEAEGGTLFLDEVDTLPLPTQAKLLQLVEEKEYKPLGTSKLSKVNTRIVAASNADLETLVKEKYLRRDLYYRLDVIRLPLPALRERREDIPLLAEHFLHKYGEGRGRGFSFSPTALRVLQEQDWPGNVRELEHLIEGALLFAQHSELHEADLGLAPSGRRNGLGHFDQAKASAVEQFERRFVQEALRANGGNISQAAKAVGKNRRVFWELMRKHNISGT